MTVVQSPVAMILGNQKEKAQTIQAAPERPVAQEVQTVLEVPVAQEVKMAREALGVKMVLANEAFLRRVFAERFHSHGSALDCSP